MRSPQATPLRDALVATGRPSRVRSRACWRSPDVPRGGSVRWPCGSAVVLYELTPRRASLEQAYMELTRDAVEYREGRRDAPHELTHRLGLYRPSGNHLLARVVRSEWTKLSRCAPPGWPSGLRAARHRACRTCSATATVQQTRNRELHRLGSTRSPSRSCRWTFGSGPRRLRRAADVWRIRDRAGAGHPRRGARRLPVVGEGCRAGRVDRGGDARRLPRRIHRRARPSCTVTPHSATPACPARSRGPALVAQRPGRLGVGALLRHTAGSITVLVAVCCSFPR